ncbi:MAG: DUF4390 domain-containing protein [Rubrivivax sp.]|nr:DUF4390 domain-containing protein [Rubrivivax sp.]MDP3224132.1 DUF4390 domain-containing protein [Rubrivivax sp.]MDP3613492.1 DUF4390 domain-containing protein [Rubrivivax sp.]
MHVPLVRQHIKQDLLALLLVLAVLLSLLLTPAAVRAQGVELLTLETNKSEGTINLDFVARVTLPKAVEDALQRGVPVYFVAEAQMFRNRWYWRDERVARVSRSWRLAYRPLTSDWRVSLGGLSQTYSTMAEALAIVSRSGNWKLVDVAQLDGEKSFYVEFSYRLDTTQLPGPMQFGLGGQSDWALGASRTLKVEP